MILPRPEGKTFEEWAPTFVKLVQDKLNELEQKIADVTLTVHTADTLPDPTTCPGRLVYVSDADDGLRVAYSDGELWLWVSVDQSEPVL